MDHITSNSKSSVWNYECFGPGGSTVLTRSQAEALFWHSMGYVILHVSNWAL